MDNDDRPVGRLLSRREALAVLGAFSAAALAACAPNVAGRTAPTAPATVAQTNTVAPSAAPTLPATTGAATSAATAPATATAASTSAGSGAAAMCVVRPAMTEGPYFVDEKLNRSDIRS